MGKRDLTSVSEMGSLLNVRGADHPVLLPCARVWGLGFRDQGSRFRV